MAESPGKLLSSICLGAGNSSTNAAKFGGPGCVNIFLHLFDWNRRLSRRGLFLNKKLLASLGASEEQPVKKKSQKRRRKTVKMNEDQMPMPMAKLLLIADEKRRHGPSKNYAAQIEQPRNKINSSSSSSKNKSEAPCSVVARLMGLEQMPESATRPRSRCPSSASAELRSLQELLHSDQEESPKMLQEFLSSSSSSSNTTEQQQQQQRSRVHHEEQEQEQQQESALLDLLIQEVKASYTPDQNQQQNQQSRAPNLLSRQVLLSPSRSPSKCHKNQSATTKNKNSSGCGGFSKSTSGLFLEAAAKILDPRSRNHLSGSCCRDEEEQEEAQLPLSAEDLEVFTRRKKAACVRRRVVSAPCSPIPESRSNNNGNGSSSISGCTSIRSLMELFLDDLEEDMQRGRQAVSEPCSPAPDHRRQQAEQDDAATCSSSSSSSNSSSNACSTAADRAQGEPVPVSNLEEHDYVSFRDFLTSGGRKLKTAAEDSHRNLGDSQNTNADEDSQGIRLRATRDCCEEEEEEEEEELEELEELEEEEEEEEEDAPDKHHFRFMVNNPLFEAYGSDIAETEIDRSTSEDEQDDQGLEDILKSILYQTTSDAATKQQGNIVDTSRLTWYPDSSSSFQSGRENYLFNHKDGASSCCSNDDSSHQMDTDSVELTSESNCGEDCGQPSPVSVLDSPFDDDLQRRAAKNRAIAARRRLDFGDHDPAAAATTAPRKSSELSSSSSCIGHLQRFDLNTLQEAEEYIWMILEESGIAHHADISLLLLLPSNGNGMVGQTTMMINNSVFERLEDRMRVQQLIEHLEACGNSITSENRQSHHSLDSLRAHYESYHECRSRRRMVFDFVNEVLGSLVVDLLALIPPPLTLTGGLVSRQQRVVTGRELVEEVQRRVVDWRRQAFESIHDLVDLEINGSESHWRAWKDLDGEICGLGLSCEQGIFRSMVEELASDLLAMRSMRA